MNYSFWPSLTESKLSHPKGHLTFVILLENWVSLEYSQKMWQQIRCVRWCVIQALMITGVSPDGWDVEGHSRSREQRRKRKWMIHLQGLWEAYQRWLRLPFCYTNDSGTDIFKKESEWRKIKVRENQETISPVQ